MTNQTSSLGVIEPDQLIPQDAEEPTGTRVNQTRTGRGTGGNSGMGFSGLGTYNERGQVGAYGYGAPSSSDPDAMLAYMTRADAQAYERDYAQFERDMLDRASNDKSLIDDARTDSQMASTLASGVVDRNRSRYGANLTPAQMQQQQQSFKRDTTLGSIQSLQDARLSQRDLNQDMLGKVIDIGQGVYQRSMQGMTAAASNKKALDNAYASGKAQSKANTYSTIGSLGSAAIMAAVFL